MRLSGLFRYPIKATRAEALTTAALGLEGVADDRRFVISGAAGVALTQRDTPKLATIEARLSVDGTSLELRSGSFALNVSVATTGHTVQATLFGASLSLVDQGSECVSGDRTRSHASSRTLLTPRLRSSLEQCTA